MANQNESPLLSKKELAKRSGLSCATLTRYTRRGLIPYFQPAGKGGRLLYPEDAIERAATAVATLTTIGEAGAVKPLSGPRPRWQTTQPAEERKHA